MGATAVALSEAETERYYVSRSMFDFLGNKDGADIFRDRVSGEYYSDDVCSSLFFYCCYCSSSSF